MATFNKIGPHNWEFRLRYTDKKTLKKHELRRHGFYTKPDAEDSCTEMRKQLEQGYDVDSKESVVEFIKYWLKTYKLGKVAKNTYRMHERNLTNHIVPYFQSLPLSDLTPDVYQTFINSLVKSGKYSKRTIEIIHGTMYGAMKRAKINKKIMDNPCEGVVIYSAREKKEQENEKKEITFIPYDKISDFLDAALLDGYDHYIFFKFLIETGMRKGEAMALQWSDVDLKNGTIKIEHPLDYEVIQTSDPFGDTKTYGSQRTFKITNSFLLELKAHQVRQNENKDRFGALYKHDLNLVFCRADGSPLRKSTLFNAFRRILKKVGLPQLRIHSLRHTHAVLYLESGAMMKDLQMRLGHSSMKITEDIYAHSSDLIQNDSINKFEKHTDKILNRRAKSGQDRSDRSDAR